MPYDVLVIDGVARMEDARRHWRKVDAYGGFLVATSRPPLGFPSQWWKRAEGISKTIYVKPVPGFNKRKKGARR